MGAAPVIPGMTKTEGIAPGGMSPMQMVAMMLGQRPAPVDSTTEKMATIVQLLREVSKEDPKLGMLASDALRLLIEGPTGSQGGSPVAQAPPGGPGSIIPMGGPGGTM